MEMRSSGSASSMWTMQSPTIRVAFQHSPAAWRPQGNADVVASAATPASGTQDSVVAQQLLNHHHHHREDGPRLAGATMALLAGLRSGIYCGRSSKRRGRRERPSTTFRRFMGSFTSLDEEREAEETRKRLQPLVDEINSLEPSMKGKSDAELVNEAAMLKSKARADGNLDALLPTAFALVREASRRVLGLRHFDVQLMAGIALHKGAVAEMATGEGKTLAAILPAFLHSLTGNGVHIVSVNDYLTRRDAETVGQPLRFLGVSVGVIQAGMDVRMRQRAYACGVTYVASTQLGFDYLGDQLCLSPPDLCMRLDKPFTFAIVDEADSILLDDARNPLIISGEAAEPSPKHAVSKELAEHLMLDIHYTREEKDRRCTLTDEGMDMALQLLGKTDLYEPADPWAPYVNAALEAKEFMLRDQQYIVENGEVIIVDVQTGRTLPGRRWDAGIHQAVEAKEGVPIRPEQIAKASISYQGLFHLYGRLAGMTGTAATEAKEFNDMYSLDVAVIPRNLPSQRIDSSDLVYVSEEARWEAVASEVDAAYRVGRPVLIGTTSVESSEVLAAKLDARDIPYRLLNAKPENAAQESEIVAGSGRKGAVTIATNMAGRGTDIVLGGNSALMAQIRVREELFGKLFPGDRRVATTSLPAGFFPVDLSPETMAAVKEHVDIAVASLSEDVSELQMLERLVAACEAVTPPVDAVAASLRDAFTMVKQEFDVIVEREHKEVVDLGGLCIIGTGRHDSRRIDNQLRGRAGRQGDPGESRFFLSLDDQILRVFGDKHLAAVAMAGGGAEDVPLSSPVLSRNLDVIQEKCENYYSTQRQDIFQYDQVLDEQRKVVYELRMQALIGSGDEVEKMMQVFCEESLARPVDVATDASQPVEEWQFQRIANAVDAWFTGYETPTVLKLREVAGDGGTEAQERLKTFLIDFGMHCIKAKGEIISKDGPLLHQAVFRQIILQQIDRFWQRHLQNMGHLKNTAALRAMGQQDPLVEFKREGYRLFADIMMRIRHNVVYNVFLYIPHPLKHVTNERLEELVNSSCRGSDRSLGPRSAAAVASALEPFGGDEGSSSTSSSSSSSSSASAHIEQDVALGLDRVMERLSALKTSGEPALVCLEDAMPPSAGADSKSDPSSHIAMQRERLLRHLIADPNIKILEDEYARQLYVSLQP